MSGQGEGVTSVRTIEDKLFTINTQPHEESHISCFGDAGDWAALDPLLWCCPAKVYTKNDETGLLAIQHENCIECNTCAILCPDHILWVWPKGGHGIRYQYG